VKALEDFYAGNYYGFNVMHFIIMILFYEKDRVFRVSAVEKNMYRM